MLECKQSKCSIVINKSRWIRKVMKWYSGYSILRSRLEWLKLVHLNILDCKQRCTGSDKYVTVMLQVWHVTVTPLNLRKCDKEVTGTPLSRKNVTSQWQWASDTELWQNSDIYVTGVKVTMTLQNLKTCDKLVNNNSWFALEFF